MNQRAGELMGETVLGGVRLESPQWYGEAVMTDGTDGFAGSVVQQGIANVVGKAAGHLMVGASLQEASLPGEGGVYYVAVGPARLGFFSVKQGLVRTSVGDLLVVHSRSELVSLDVKYGYLSRVQFIFADGTNYVLMCSRMQRGKLRRLHEVLTRPLAS